MGQVGTGPFIISEVVPSSYAKYVRNPIYWDTTTINGVEYSLPFVDELIYPIIPDESTQIAALRSGKLDFLHTVDLVYKDSLAKSAPELITSKWLMAYGRAVLLQSSESQYEDKFLVPSPYPDGLFTNPDLRRAIAYATDQQALGEAVYEDFVLNNLYLPRGDFMYTAVADMPEQARMMFEYHPDLARKLMADRLLS